MTPADVNYLAIEQIAAQAARDKEKEANDFHTVAQQAHHGGHDDAYMKHWKRVRKATEFAKRAENTLEQADAAKAEFGETTPSVATYFAGLHELLKAARERMRSELKQLGQ